jgi:hypothetical protein
VPPTFTEKVGVLDHLVHVRHRRENCIAALAAGGQHREVRERGGPTLVARVGRDEVEDPGLVACCGQLVDDVRADEARAARDENLH